MLDASDLCVAWVAWSLLFPPVNTHNISLKTVKPAYYEVQVASQDSEMWQHFLLQAHPLNNFLIVPIKAPECTRYRSEIWLCANGIHTLQTAFARYRHVGQTGKMISPSANSSYLLVMYGYNSFTTKKKHRFVFLAKQYLSFNPFFIHRKNFLIWMYCCLLCST